MLVSWASLPDKPKLGCSFSTLAGGFLLSSFSGCSPPHSYRGRRPGRRSAERLRLLSGDLDLDIERLRLSSGDREYDGRLLLLSGERENKGRRRRSGERECLRLLGDRENERGRLLGDLDEERLGDRE